MKYYYLSLLFFLSSYIVTLSEDKHQNLLPKLLGASNTGKVFYLTFHPCWESADSNNGIYIYVSSVFKTTVKLEIPGLGIIRTKEIMPYKVIQFTLTFLEAQVYSKEIQEPQKPEQIWKGRAIKITAEDPIICYGVSRVSFSTDGYMAIPVNNWGKNYQVASYADIWDYMPSYTSIVAAYDNTLVSFKLGGNPNTGVLLENSDTLKFGQVITKTMNAGDVWLIPGIGINNDLTGSQIAANRNIGVISGNFATQVPIYANSCDYLIEQELPSEYWGKKYYVPSIMNRLNSPIVKVFAKMPNTKITFDNIPLFNIAALDGKVGTGFIEARTTSDLKPKPVLISADKEINVVLFNPGQSDDNIESDPFQMNIIPEAQFQTNISFNTPGILGGLGYRVNFLHIIFKSDTKSIPDDMIIGEIINDSIKWTPLATFFENYELGTFDGEQPDEDGNLYYSVSGELPRDGVYELKAFKPFAAYGYGYSSYDSYGFPLAGGLINQTSNDNLAPILNVDNLGNGNYIGQIFERGILKGKTQKDKIDLQTKDDISGFSFVEMINDLSYNYKFERDEFIPGDTKSIKYTLTKIDSSKDSKAVIYISDRRGNDTSFVLESKISNSVEEFESKYGSISCYVKDKQIIFYSNDDIILNSYKIYDLKGKIILSGSLVTILNNFNIKLPNLTASVYFIELNTKYGKIVKKFILE